MYPNVQMGYLIYRHCFIEICKHKLDISENFLDHIKIDLEIKGIVCVWKIILIDFDSKRTLTTLFH